MAKYSAVVKKNSKEAHDYIETVDNDVNLDVIPFDHGNDTGFIITEGSAFRDACGATLVVAASDSLDTLTADYVCAGADDQDTIQTAISALPATGGTVILREGKYVITDYITMDSYTTLRGVGWGTILEVASTISGTLDLIQISGSTEQVSVEDLFIDGNDAAHSEDVTAIKIIEGASYINIDHVKIMRCKDGIEGNAYGNIDYCNIMNCHVEDISDDGLDLNYMRNSRIVNNTIKDIGDNGIDTERIAHSVISDNIVYNCGGHGIELESEVYYSCYACVISNNVIMYCSGNGIEANSGQESVISGNKIYDVAHGIYIGCVAYVGTTDQRYGGRLAITGNHIDKCSGDGIKEEAGEIHGSVIVGNLLSTITGTALNLNHADTIAYGNLGAAGYGTFDMGDNAIKNPKNTTGTASGTPIIVEIDVGGTPYYINAYPTLT